MYSLRFDAWFKSSQDMSFLSPYLNFHVGIIQSVT